jgi:hypothetical protein
MAKESKEKENERRLKDAQKRFDEGPENEEVDEDGII